MEKYFIQDYRDRKTINTIPDYISNIIDNLYHAKNYDTNSKHFTDLLWKSDNIYIYTSGVRAILKTNCIFCPR